MLIILQIIYKVQRYYVFTLLHLQTNKKSIFTISIIFSTKICISVDYKGFILLFFYLAHNKKTTEKGIKKIAAIPSIRHNCY